MFKGVLCSCELGCKFCMCNDHWRSGRPGPDIVGEKGVAGLRVPIGERIHTIV